MRQKIILMISVSVWFFLAMSHVEKQQSDLKDPERSRPKKGEQCLICGVDLTKNDLVLTIRGRRAPLNASMVDSFLANQDFFFARLQPRGALFNEAANVKNATVSGGISFTVFAIGLYVLVGLIFGGLSAYQAVSKGLPAVSYFRLGFLFNVLGLVWAITRPASTRAGNIPRGLAKVSTTATPIHCDKCSCHNHPSAQICLECGANLTPKYHSDVTRIAE